ncbi:MAG: hypothetical protein J2P17_14630 [Mycobacterium sp.]|nr:hypothetical protein [Mycobacterium sp.]
MDRRRDTVERLVERLVEWGNNYLPLLERYYKSHRSAPSRGSIYHRFATVDDLLAAMGEHAVRRSQELFLRMPDSRPSTTNPGKPNIAAAALRSGSAWGLSFSVS